MPSAPAVIPHNMVIPPADPLTPIRRRPARVPGLVGTNAAFLVPDHIRKKFIDGWSSHVPLTYLTDKGCLLKNKSTNPTQDVLSFDASTGHVTTTSMSLPDNGELDMTFDEWHQAWRRLLELIKAYIPQDFLAWEVHYSFILNSENRAEMWPLYLAYDAEIRRRTTHLGIDPSKFSIGIWNDLETRYTAKKVLSIVHADMKHYPDRSAHPHPSSSNPRNPSQGSSFRNNRTLLDSPKTGRCIFCGCRAKTHLSRNCTASCYANGSTCHLARQEPFGTRVSQSGKRYCFSWNGPSGCDQIPCKRGEHLCTLCGTPAHNAQQCNIVP